MKHKLLIGWALALIASSLIGLIFIDYPVIASVMIPVEIIVASSVVPIAYINHNLDARESGRTKKKFSQKASKSLRKSSRIVTEKANSLESKRSRYLNRESSEISILEDDIENDAQILVEDLEIVTSENEAEGALGIIMQHFSNKEALEIVNSDNSLEVMLKSLNDVDLNFFSKEFFEKLDKLEWKNDEELLEFVRDMMSFSPSERISILNDMRATNA